MPKPKPYHWENDYDTAIGCMVCGAAIHPNMLESASKEKVRCPVCKSIFMPKRDDLR
jgi:DNA-directed RNA polymerase subunit RPC12/RpoP